MPLPRVARAALSGICWTIAVLSALLSAAAFAGGGVLCQKGKHEACVPQTWLLVVGVVLAVAFGFAGAKLYTPRRKRETRYPWEYHD